MVQGLRVAEYAGKAQQARHPAAAGPVRERAGAEGTTMQELRFVVVSEDTVCRPGGTWPARFTLPITNGSGRCPRLVAQYEIEVRARCDLSEIQARIRAGETVEEIADGIAIERVRWLGVRSLRARTRPIRPRKHR